MGIGYESYTETGKLQFNSEMFTYALQSCGQVVAEVRQVGNTSPRSVMLPSTYTGKFVALSAGNGYSAGYAGLYYLSPGDTRRIYATDAPAGTVFTYYVFGLSTGIQPSNFGMEIRNAANQITFSSNHRTMKVLNIVGAGNGSVTYGGKSLAYAQGQWSGHRYAGEKTYSNGGGGGGTGPIGPIRDPDAPPTENGGTLYSSYRNDGKVYGGTVLDGGQTVSGATLSWDDVQIGPGPDEPTATDFNIPLKLFVIDVTGFPTTGTFF